MPAPSDRLGVGPREGIRAWSSVALKVDEVSSPSAFLDAEEWAALPFLHSPETPAPPSPPLEAPSSFSNCHSVLKLRFHSPRPSEDSRSPSVLGERSLKRGEGPTLFGQMPSA